MRRQENRSLLSCKASEPWNFHDCHALSLIFTITYKREKNVIKWNLKAKHEKWKDQFE